MIPAARILIVLHGAIGDVVRALPLLMRLRAGYPRARITWAVEPIAAPLLFGHPALDATIMFDRRRGAPAFLRFLRAVRGLRADVVLDLQRHLKSGIVSRVSGAPVRIGFHRRNTKEGNWLFNNRYLPGLDPFGLKLQQYLAFADYLGVPQTPICFGLAPNDDDRTRCDRLLGDHRGRLAAVCVGSTWTSRLWFPDRNAEVVRGLRARGLDPVLIGAPSERPLADATLGHLDVPALNLVGRTRLRDLVAIFERSAVVIAPDSGPMHIAAAMGCRVVSLWGATSPKRSAPWGSQNLVVQGLAECVPCYKRQCPIGQLCMQSISAAAVLERVDAALAESPQDGSKM